MLRPNNRLPHVTVTLPIKLFPLFLHKYNFTAVMSCNVYIYVFGCSWGNPINESFNLPRGHDSPFDNYSSSQLEGNSVG